MYKRFFTAMLCLSLAAVSPALAGNTHITATRGAKPHAKAARMTAGHIGISVVHGKVKVQPHAKARMMAAIHISVPKLKTKAQGWKKP